MADPKKPPPPTPDLTDPDLSPIREAKRDPKRFDLDAEVTVNADVTKTHAEPAKPSETVLGESAPNLGPGSTFDDLSAESAVPSVLNLAAHPASTAIFDDEDAEATQAIVPPISEATETPTPVKPKGGTGKQAAHKPGRRIDVASGTNRVPKHKPKPQPMGADAFEPVVASAELSNTTHNDLKRSSFSFLNRLADESWPVKLGLAAAIVFFTGFVFWLIFLAAR